MQVNKVNSLYLAWQGPSRAWYPIGLLEADSERDHYVFQYTQGVLRAKKEGGFEPLLSFPDLRTRYESERLFPLFKNRVLNFHRRDFEEYLQSLDLDPEHPDPVEILAITGGERQTDNLEVFPKIVKSPDNRFQSRFFLHGLRHVSKIGQHRGMMLEPGDTLQVSIEMNNPATGLAIQLSTKDYMFVGWAPRYLVGDILSACGKSTDVNARVVRVNDTSVPIDRRVLVEFSGQFPSSVDPMSESDFQVIH